MKGFTVLLRKEVMEQSRSRKFLAMVAIFLVLAILPVVVAAIVAEVQDHHRDADDARGILGFFIGFVGSFVGTLLAIMVMMGSISGERESGTAAMTPAQAGDPRGICSRQNRCLCGGNDAGYTRQWACCLPVGPDLVWGWGPSPVRGLSRSYGRLFNFYRFYSFILECPGADRHSRWGLGPGNFNIPRRLADHP